MNIQRKQQFDMKFAIIITILALFLISGCVQSPEAPKVGVPSSKVHIPAPQHFAGVSVENRPIMYSVIGNGSDVTFIIGGIHGDEPASPQLTNQLADYLNQNQNILIGRKVVILPVANPDGLAYKTRANANKVDINRNFPADNRINDPNYGSSGLSEPESHIIYTLIQQYKPARIVSIHQPYACIDYDGQAEELAQQMALHCDLPVEKVGALPGSLGSYAGLTLGIPIITFEMREHDSILNTQLLWQRYGKALLAATTFPNPVQ